MHLKFLFKKTYKAASICHCLLLRIYTKYFWNGISWKLLDDAKFEGTIIQRQQVILSMFLSIIIRTISHCIQMASPVSSLPPSW